MKTLFERAKKLIPGGVNSPVRAFKAVGGVPIFFARGKGAFVWDEAGKKYTDFCCSWGPLLLGHAPAGLISVLKKEISKGTSFGAATAKEVKLAEKINKFFPSMEKLRLVSSGTEAVMSAIRVARGFTGRDKILKLDGGYHGHADSFLVKAGSGVATLGVPDSAGVPKELARLTLSIPFNNFEQLERVFKKEGKNLAAFILEPVPANMGVVLPKPGYLQRVRQLTRKYGVVLIFDEVITGFRLAPGGAQEFYGIKPDMTCLGKILGGGLPLAAFGGRRDIMEQLAPLGSVYQAGTLSGNPVAVTAALWMLDQLKPKLYQKLEAQTKALVEKIRILGYPVTVNQVGSMFTVFFTKHPVSDYAGAKLSNTQKYAKYFHECLKQGVYLAPSQFEANFISTAHSKDLLKRTANIFQQALAKCF